MIKAIFFDIDGTLVGFHHKELDEVTMEALRKLKEKGVLLFISSGRSLYMIHNLCGFPFDGYICNNGALVYVDGKVIFREPVNQEDALALAEIADDNDIPCVAFAEHCPWMNMENEISKGVLKMLHIAPIEKRSMREAIKSPVFQFTIYANPQQEEKLLVPCLKHVCMPRWHEAFVDVVPAEISKADAVGMIMDRFSLEREEVMAIGDGGNDVGMIKAAGIGVAMGNSEPQVKAQADYVAGDADEEGVVEALRHFGLV